MQLLSFFFALLLWWQQMPAQKVPKSNAVQHIQMLKEGHLLVMLPEDSPLPGLDITKQKYSTMVKAFTDNYHFSEVYFFYRVDARLLRKRDSRVRIFNSKWERVPVSALQEKNFYISTINFTEEVSLPALIVLDSAFQHLPHPFPNPIRIYSSVPLLEIPISKAVSKLNQRLADFALSNLKEKSAPKK